MADKLDVIGTCSNLEQRLNALNGLTLESKFWITELMIQVTLLTKMCSQQQTEINRLKSMTGLIG